MKNFMKKTAKGFTLVELIIVIGLMSVLMIMVGLIMKPISQVFADTTSYTEDRYVMDGLAQYLDDSLKYADEIFLVYDQGNPSSFCSLGAGFVVTNCGMCNGALSASSHVCMLDSKYLNGYGSVTAAEAQANFDKLQCIAIINDFGYATGKCFVEPEDFTNNNGVKSTCRVYKSDVINGARKTGLVGGEAFYGDDAYFLKLENTTPTAHMAQGDISYTLYSFDMDQYEKLTEREVKNMCLNMRHKDPDEVMEQHGQYIANRVERTINFKNDINWGHLYVTSTGYEGGAPSPISATIGTSPSAGNDADPAENVQGKYGDLGNPIGPCEGVNIFIYYHVPE